MGWLGHARQITLFEGWLCLARGLTFVVPDPGWGGQMGKDNIRPAIAIHIHNIDRPGIDLIQTLFLKLKIALIPKDG